MRFLVPVLALLAALSACGDDDEPGGGGGYYAGVRDTGLALEEERAEIRAQAATNTGLTMAPAYRAEADAFVRFADGLRALRPPDEAADAHASLFEASRSTADHLEALADAVEIESEDEAVVALRDMLEGALLDDAQRFTEACEDLEAAAGEDLHCTFVAAADNGDY